MLCARFVWGYQTRQNQNNMSSALWSYKKGTQQYGFFPITNRRSLPILTFWYQKKNAHTALWDLKKIENTGNWL